MANWSLPVFSHRTNRRYPFLIQPSLDGFHQPTLFAGIGFGYTSSVRRFD